jgi:hypothetical protein
MVNPAVTGVVRVIWAAGASLSIVVVCRAVDQYAKQLAERIDACLPRWVERCVRDVMVAWQGGLPPHVEAAAHQAGVEAGAEVSRHIRRLLESDIDEQRTTPLQVVRAAVRYPTAVLAAAGAPALERDPFAEAAFPADVYDLSPASWAEVDPTLTEPGIAWGAAKAFAHKQRHRTPS